MGKRSRTPRPEPYEHGMLDVGDGHLRRATPERVSELVLFAVATGRRAEVDLLVRGLGPMFPEAWARFRDGA